MANLNPEPAGRGANWLPVVATVQGVFYLLTGIWPLVSSASFERVTGPKADLWLVKTIGALIGVIGGILLAAGLRRRISPEVAALALGSAASLTGADIVYTTQQRIPPVYLLDAAAEIAVIAAWLFGLATNRSKSTRIDFQI